MEIYTFDKSLQERLVEFTEILSSRGDIVPASQIQAEWSYHVELVIEPVGWQALWKISRLVCQDFQVHYPTIVIVEVEQVDFSELSALVKITAVQDEIHLPEKYDVPLVELYPTHIQQNAALDMIGTATCIDQLRFFFNYLWMPWDIDDDDNTDWVALHLEPRIRLFFDMKRGVVDKETCDVIRTFVREARDIQEKISRLEAAISDEEETEVLDEGKTCQLMKLHFRLQQIKTEMEVLENPAMREMLTRNQDSSSTDRRRNSERKSKNTEAHFVWLGGSLREMRDALDKIQVFLPQDALLKTSGSLQRTLHSSDAGDVVILGEGSHSIRGVGGLEEGGTIKGIYDVERTILSPMETDCGPSLLDFSGDEVLLENVSIDLAELQVGVIVRKGTVKVNGCKIYSSKLTTVKLGVVVLPGAKLILERSTFEGLGTAVVIYATGEVTASECSFNNCAEGVQLQDNASLVVKNCLMGYFKEYGIRLETQKYLDGSESKYGTFELLDNVTEVSLENCKFEGNGKADVALKSRIVAPLASRKDGAVIS